MRRARSRSRGGGLWLWFLGISGGCSAFEDGRVRGYGSIHRPPPGLILGAYVRLHLAVESIGDLVKTCTFERREHALIWRHMPGFEVRLPVEVRAVIPPFLYRLVRVRRIK